MITTQISLLANLPATLATLASAVVLSAALYHGLPQTIVNIGRYIPRFDSLNGLFGGVSRYFPRFDMVQGLVSRILAK